ncbi:MAG: hypothetical protein GXO90_06260 [FCB group bacterium]|nr:hypothetical protein [FCB group bacterium]
MLAQLEDNQFFHLIQGKGVILMKKTFLFLFLLISGIVQAQSDTLRVTYSDKLYLGTILETTNDGIWFQVGSSGDKYFVINQNIKYLSKSDGQVLINNAQIQKQNHRKKPTINSVGIIIPEETDNNKTSIIGEGSKLSLTQIGGILISIAAGMDLYSISQYQKEIDNYKNASYDDPEELINKAKSVDKALDDRIAFTKIRSVFLLAGGLCIFLDQKKIVNGGKNQ